MKSKGNPKIPFYNTFFFAEDEGFKPPIPVMGIPDFESSAIDHSANSPVLLELSMFENSVAILRVQR